SSSSGGGDGAAVGALIELLFAYPPLGLAVLGIVVVAFFIQHRDNSRSYDARAEELQTRMESAGKELERARAQARRQSEMRAELERIAEHDPSFSVALFEDFLYALYAETHTARGANQLERYAAWIGQSAQIALLQLESDVVSVSAIVIGAM